MTKKNKVDYNLMLNKLNELYDIEEQRKKDVNDALDKLEQTKHDIELLELMIMHKYNTEARNVRR